MKAFEEWWLAHPEPVYHWEYKKLAIAAYRAGMLRAAEIADDVEEGCGYGCPNTIVDAIRNEADNEK